MTEKFGRLTIGAVLHAKEGGGGEKPVKKWIGDAPTHCDVCHREIKDNFVDGRMRGASWANMCMPCHAELGVGLGLGKGQYYTRRGSEWIKVEG
jgi:hypothetical protein